MKFRIDDLNHRRVVLRKYLQEFVDESEVIDSIKETCHRDLDDTRTELNHVQQASHILNLSEVETELQHLSSVALH